MRKQNLLFISFLATAAFLAGSAGGTPTSGKLTKIAVLTLKNGDGISKSEAELISDRLRNEFFSTGAFEVMERDQMQEVLKEQGFQQSGACTDEGCLVEMGKILGVSRLIGGSIGKLGSMFLVNIRSINVLTGTIEKVVSRDIRGSIEDIAEALPGIATEISGASSIVRQTPPSVREPQPEEQEEEQSPPSPSLDPVEFDCSAPYYLERISLTKSQIGFDLSAEDALELDNMLCTSFQESLEKTVGLATAQQLAEAQGCTAGVIRIHLTKYTTAAARMKQKEGTATVTIALFSSVRENAPVYSITLEKTGERHWGDPTPLLNAFEEIADESERPLREFSRKHRK